MTKSILYDSHMHTPLCKHAKGEPEEYAAVAEKRGLKGIVMTCHNPGPEGFSTRVRMSISQFDDYLAMVERARAAWHGRVDVRLGLESDYVPGMESFLEDLHARADFDYILGSLHPQLPYYKDEYYDGDVSAFQQTYFQHLAQAAETGLFDALSHPDLVKNVFPLQWNVESLLPDIRVALDRIAQTGVAMELNTYAYTKSIKEMLPNRTMLVEMVARNIPIVLGSDAHVPRDVANDFEKALDLLEEVGYQQVYYYLKHQRHQVNIMAARYSLL